MNKKTPENEECARNVEAVLCGLVDGIDLDVFRSRLADLPALSIYSDYHIVDYVSELEIYGCVVINAEENRIQISNADLKNKIKRYEDSGKARLDELLSDPIF